MVLVDIMPPLGFRAGDMRGGNDNLSLNTHPYVKLVFVHMSLIDTAREQLDYKSLAIQWILSIEFVW